LGTSGPPDPGLLKQVVSHRAKPHATDTDERSRPHHSFSSNARRLPCAHASL